MVSFLFVPWYNRPARPFPAKVWLEARYPFLISPLVFARLTARPLALAASGRRRFPAQVWQEAQQGAGG